TEMVTDTVTHATFSHGYALNLVQVIGGNAAFVGFTGGTGGETAVQDIVSWTGAFQQAGGVTNGFPNRFANPRSPTANHLTPGPQLTVFTSPPVAVNSANFATHSGLTANGSASFPANPPVLRLTDGGGGEAGSAYYTTPVLVGPFTTTFTLHDTN